MAKTESDIRRDLAGFCRRAVSEGNMFVCKVTDIDSDGRTCTVEDDGITYYNVRLQAVTEFRKGLLIQPKIGSYAIAAYVDSGDLSLLMLTEIEILTLDVGKIKLRIDSDGIVVNGGGNGGVVKIDALADWMQNVSDDLHKLQALLSSHKVPPNGSALGLLFFPKTSPPQKDLLANKHFKH